MTPAQQKSAHVPWWILSPRTPWNWRYWVFQLYSIYPKSHLQTSC